MKNVTQGSALLLVLIVMALLISVISLATKTTFFAQSLSYDFHKTQQRATITQGMLAYAVAVARENYDECMAHSAPCNLTLDLVQYHGAITMTQADGNLALEATLYERPSQTKACSMRCILARDAEKKFEVQCFQR